MKKLIKENLFEEILTEKTIYMVFEPSGDGWDDAAIGLIWATSKQEAKEEIFKILNMDSSDIKYYHASELDPEEYENLLKNKTMELTRAQAEYNKFKNIHLDNNGI